MRVNDGVKDTVKEQADEAVNDQAGRARSKSGLMPVAPDQDYGQTEHYGEAYHH